MELQSQDLCLIAGGNLKRLIKESGLKSQKEFADRFGADERTVGRWINQGIDKISTVTQIARFFHVDALTLLSS